MSKGEIRKFERLLLEQASKSQSINILEWGSGGSTVYFTDFLNKQGINYSWTSIEYNKRWYETVKEKVAGNSKINLVLFDSGNDKLKQDDTDMSEYVNYPKTLNTKIDLIFVDGRKRRSCLLTAREALNPTGVTILHDAERRYYHCALKKYPRSRFTGVKMWIGRLEQADNWTRLIDKLSWIINRLNYYVWFGAWIYLKPRLASNFPVLLKIKKAIFGSK